MQPKASREKRLLRNSKTDAESAVTYRTGSEKFCHSGHGEIFFYRLLFSMSSEKHGLVNLFVVH